MKEFRVKISLKTKQEGVVTLKDGRLGVSVRADRKQGAANARLITVLAQHFHVQEDCIAITSGHTSGTKTVRIKA